MVQAITVLICICRPGGDDTIDVTSLARGGQRSTCGVIPNHPLGHRTQDHITMPACPASRHFEANGYAEKSEVLEHCCAKMQRSCSVAFHQALPCQVLMYIPHSSAPALPRLPVCVHAAWVEVS